MNEATPAQQETIAVLTQMFSSLGVIEQAQILPIAIGFRDLFVTAKVNGNEFSCFVGVKGNVWTYKDKQRINGQAVFQLLLGDSNDAV